MSELETGVIKAIFPSLKEGRRADQIDATLPCEIGAAGRSDSASQDSDLPGCAVAKVARHFISTAQPPLLQGGEMTSTRNPGYAGTRLSQRLEQSIAVGLMVVLFFTTLAHGAVEPWSIAIFELMLIGILLLWGIKIPIHRRLDVNVPSA